MNYHTKPLTPSTTLTDFLVLPRCLLQSGRLNPTALLLYMLLLDRARISCRSPGYTDQQGRVFVYYPLKELGQTLGKGHDTILRALGQLQQEGLIQRKHRGTCLANQIFLYVPKASLGSDPQKSEVPYRKNQHRNTAKIGSSLPQKSASSYIEKSYIEKSYPYRNGRPAWGSSPEAPQYLRREGETL